MFSARILAIAEPQLPEPMMATLCFLVGAILLAVDEVDEDVVVEGDDADADICPATRANLAAAREDMWESTTEQVRPLRVLYKKEE